MSVHSAVHTSYNGGRNNARQWSRNIHLMKIPSLFDDHSEDDYSSDSDDEGSLQSKHVPFNDIIAVVPKTYSDLLNTLLPRLQPRPDIKGVSIEIQQELSHILANELATHFLVIQHQINDPFLSPNSNKELHRCIVVKVCSIIEDLYKLYLSKLSSVHNDSIKDIFTRLKAELMVEANRSLNIPLIRRSVLQELRGVIQLSHIPSGQRPLSPIAPPSNSINELNKVKLKCPKLRLPPGYSEQVTAEGQRTIINERGVVHYNDIPTTTTTELPFTEDYSISVTDIDTTSSVSSTDTIQQMREPMGVSFSAPVLPIRTNKDVKIRKPVTVEDVEGLKLGCYGDKEASTNKVKLGEYTDEMIKQDLMNLVERNQKIRMTSSEDDESMELSPLLAAGGMGLSERKLNALKQYMSKHDCNNNGRLSEEVDSNSRPLPATDPSPPSPDTPPLVSSGIEITQLNLGNASPDSSTGRMLSYSSNSLDYSYLQSSCDSIPKQTLDNNSEQFLSSPSDTHPHLRSNIVLSPDEACLVNSDDNRGSPFINEDNNIGLIQHDMTNNESYSNSKRSLSTVLFPEPQPDTISFSIPNMELVRASSHRVCERIPQNSLLLQPFPTLYNELTGELDDLTIEKMDAVLLEGDSIEEIYKELSETLHKDHLEVAKDPFLEPYLQEKVKMSSIYASNSLQRRRTLRVINDGLSHSGQPSPWQGTSRREWLNSFQKDDTPPERAGYSSRRKSSFHYTRLSEMKRKESKKIVESTLSLDDYQRFISHQGSDFLGVIHHMYNSSGSDSEDEERERKKREQLRKLHLQLQEKEQKRLAMLKRKTTYVAGQWNANTVLMGGLGKAPENEDNVETVNIKETQVKLEAIWDRLKVSATNRIDMTINYSDPNFSIHLPEVLLLWEKSCDAVEQREIALSNLEEYEKYSSSPSRLFSKKSTFRVSEEKARNILHYKLDAIEKKIIILAKKLRSFESILTYQGLDYLEKMSMDRTELLYFLQQERRREVLLPSIKRIHTGTHM